MATLALVLLAVWLLLVACLRTLIQTRRTGDASAPRFRDRPGSAQWWARLLSTLGFAGAVAAPLAELAGLDPIPVLDHPPVRAGGVVLVVPWIGRHTQVRVTWGQVGATAPQVVVFMPCGYGLQAAADEARRALLARPELAGAEAVVAVDASACCSRPGPAWSTAWRSSPRRCTQDGSRHHQRAPPCDSGDELEQPSPVLVHHGIAALTQPDARPDASRAALDTGSVASPGLARHPHHQGRCSLDCCRSRIVILVAAGLHGLSAHTA